MKFIGCSSPPYAYSGRWTCLLQKLGSTRYNRIHQKNYYRSHQQLLRIFGNQVALSCIYCWADGVHPCRTWSCTLFSFAEISDDRPHHTSKWRNATVLFTATFIPLRLSYSMQALKGLRMMHDSYPLLYIFGLGRVLVVVCHQLQHLW